MHRLYNNVSKLIKIHEGYLVVLNNILPLVKHDPAGLLPVYKLFIKNKEKEVSRLVKIRTEIEKMMLNKSG